MLSSLFADYADRREVQAALPATTLTLAPDADGGMWFDHVADLGDGFDPTYTVARLLAADDVAVDGPPGTRARRCASRAAGCSCSAATRSIPRRPRPGTRTGLKGPYRAALPAGAADPPPSSSPCPATTTGTTG